jgi:SAM-dependent methyltransferase
MSHSGFQDHFSAQAGGYRRYRPAYPQELFRHLAAIAPARSLAWDSATGTGQAATGLAQQFKTVIATDASARQIDNADRSAGIEYRVARSEHTDIPDDSVDLITVAQALHWFDLDAFFTEARRVLRPDGVIAAWSYTLLRISPRIDPSIEHLYQDVLGHYWPWERQLVEDGYRGIAFPFQALATPRFEMTASWTLPQLLGYLGTWSAVQRYRNTKGSDPIASILKELDAAWGEPADRKAVQWPLALRAGRYRPQGKSVTIPR